VQGPTPACRCFPSSGTYFLVRDTSGRMLTAGIYNYVMPKEDPTHVFPIGQYVAPTKSECRTQLKRLS
jgi:hypothetical protein